ncbi:hypothetical protein [Nocardioides zeae]
MLPAPSRPPLPASRRTVLAAPAALLAAPVLAACDDARSAPEGVVTATGDGTSADVERVDEALAAIGAARTRAATAGATHATLTPTLASLLAVHDAHLDLLAEANRAEGAEGADAGARPGSAGTSDPTATPGDPVLDPVTALAGVRTTETALAATLADLAVAADSGPLARTLAAMAAAVDQQLLLLAQVAA